MPRCLQDLTGLVDDCGSVRGIVQFPSISLNFPMRGRLKATRITADEAYESLLNRSREIAHLDSAIELSYWDQRTNIPKRGHAHRVRHLAALARMRHRRMSEKRVGDLLKSVEDSPYARDPFSASAVNIRLWRRTYNRVSKISEKFAAASAHAAAEGEALWEKTLPTSDWNRFSPALERIVALKREEAEAVGYRDEPYDALLDEFEPGETVRTVWPLLSELSVAVLDLLHRIDTRGSKDRPALQGLRFSVAEQQAFCRDVARRIGYNLEGGRLDVATHPFSIGIGPGDVRITATWNEHNFGEALFAVIHEAGHAMYVQALPLEHWGEPICRTASMAIDESQSLLWEYLVGRSRGFWEFWYPLAQERFPALQGVELDDFHFTLNRVLPGPIRLDADEVTYNVHIMLRFELELALIRGQIRVAELPEAWNERMNAYLGVRPRSHAEGVMQDVHWAAGLLGYFPTYSLGNMYAAHFFAEANRDLGIQQAQFAQGQYTPLREWLRAAVHAQGATYSPRELLRKVTAEDLSPRHLIDHLDQMYGRLHGLPGSLTGVRSDSITGAPPKSL